MLLKFEQTDSHFYKINLEVLHIRNMFFRNTEFLSNFTFFPWQSANMKNSDKRKKCDTMFSRYMWDELWKVT
jgi:hypothetical protein